MESENFAFFANEYQKCQILTFCKVSLVRTLLLLPKTPFFGEPLLASVPDLPRMNCDVAMSRQADTHQRSGIFLVVAKFW
jgi:hypothetical protein